MEAPAVVVVVGEVAQVFFDGFQDTAVLFPPLQGVFALACGFVWSNNLFVMPFRSAILLAYWRRF